VPPLRTEVVRIGDRLLLRLSGELRRSNVAQLCTVLVKSCPSSRPPWSPTWPGSPSPAGGAAAGGKVVWAALTAREGGRLRPPSAAEYSG
jgi:hypothetical protein